MQTLTGSRSPNGCLCFSELPENILSNIELKYQPALASLISIRSRQSLLYEHNSMLHSGTTLLEPSSHHILKQDWAGTVQSPETIDLPLYAGAVALHSKVLQTVG